MASGRQKSWRRVFQLLAPWMLCFFVTACASSTASMSKSVASLHNPLAPVADPFIVYHNNSYYLTGTHTGNSLEIWHAPHLEDVGQDSKTIWSPAPGEPAFQVWSPSMFLLDYQGSSHWFVYFTAALTDKNEDHRIYVLQSQGSDPLGPYTYKGQLTGTDNTTAIDASILQLHGQLYLMYVLEKGTNATYLAPMHDPLTVNGAPRLIIDPDQPWEQGYQARSDYPVAEGPEALYHDGKTFIVYSASDTGNYNYCLGLMTYQGGDPLERSSWQKKGPVFEYNSDNGVFGPGRAHFTTSPDGKQSWMVYHAKTTADFTYAGREVRAQPFTWNADGTPNFGTPVSVKTPLEPPSGE
ncbi:glycoside hydrolase family 43 protein [Dictyobacter formicarum]|uniref:glycoside hydrolase family 43 protein n=1 Tax=Dictyobacter formicarum TaxID=2778368 RepID=UPI001915EE9E|nr:glycoside hydrolase family 43 protein [Dictyobacter formicarum]